MQKALSLSQENNINNETGQKEGSLFDTHGLASKVAMIHYENTVAGK